MYSKEFKGETKLINSIKHLTYENRLKKLKLHALKNHIARSNIIEVFKILHGYYNNINKISLLPHIDVDTRGNKYKLYQRSVKYDLRKHFFTNRVVSLWNTLPNGVVDSDAINCFKSRLDKFWNNQDVLHNWEADFAGTKVYVHYNVLFKFALVLIGDEDTDIEALPASVNFRCLVLIGTSAQFRTTDHMSEIVVTGANLKPVAGIKSLRNILDSRLNFAAHVTAVCKACNYHIWVL